MSTFEQNPYQQSIDPVHQELHPASGVLESLRQTRPWVLFIGILGIIGSVLMVLLAIGMGAMGMAGAPGMPPGMGIGLAVAYLVMALLYIAPSIYLIQYAGRIKTLLASPSNAALEKALSAQKSFWRFVGICMLIVMILYGILILVGVAGAVAGIAAQQ